METIRCACPGVAASGCSAPETFVPAFAARVFAQPQPAPAGAGSEADNALTLRLHPSLGVDLAGDVDYMLRVVVADMSAFDDFYKRLIAIAPLCNVVSRFAMECIKSTTALPFPTPSIE
jgi:hypothetical protein